MAENFRAGDVVHHRPSDERWLLGRVDGEHVEPFGWPRSRARAEDCTLVRAASNDEHRQAATDAAQMWGGGHG